MLSPTPPLTIHPKFPSTTIPFFSTTYAYPLHLNKQTNGQTNEKEKKSKLEEGRKNNGKKNGPEGNLSSALRPLADLSSLTSGERLTFLFTWFRPRSLSLFLRLFEIDIRFFSFRLVESRRRRRHSFSLSLVFFSSPLSSNSSFSFDEHEAEERKNERCCRNGIGLINVGGPQIWLNSEQRWTSSRIKFLPEAYTTLSRTRSPFSRLFGSVGIRDDFSEGRLSSLNRLNEVFSLSLSLSPFWRIKRSKLDGVDRNIGTRGAELLDDFFGGSWRVFFFFRCALFVFRGFAIRGLDIPRDTFYVCFMHGRRKFFHVIFHGFRGNRGECNTLYVLWM